jgi:hypothetical protein
MSQGFGADTWCMDQIRTGKLARGSTVVILRLYRMTTTERGTLRGLGEDGDEGGSEDELAWGFDVSGYIGAVGPDTAARALPVLLAAQFEKDDCVQTAEVKAAITTDSAGMTSVELSCLVQLIGEEELTPFTLTANSAVVELTGVTQ